MLLGSSLLYQSWHHHSYYLSVCVDDIYNCVIPRWLIFKAHRQYLLLFHLQMSLPLIVNILWWPENIFLTTSLPGITSLVMISLMVRQLNQCHLDGSFKLIRHMYDTRPYNCCTYWLETEWGMLTDYVPCRAGLCGNPLASGMDHPIDKWILNAYTTISKHEYLNTI